MCSPGNWEVLCIELWEGDGVNLMNERHKEINSPDRRDMFYYFKIIKALLMLDCMYLAILSNNLRFLWNILFCTSYLVYLNNQPLQFSIDSLK